LKAVVGRLRQHAQQITRTSEHLQLFQKSQKACTRANNVVQLRDIVLYMQAMRQFDKPMAAQPGQHAKVQLGSRCNENYGVIQPDCSGLCIDSPVQRGVLDAPAH
jgi:hypothetical protein